MFVFPRGRVKRLHTVKTWKPIKAVLLSFLMSTLFSPFKPFFKGFTTEYIFINITFRKKGQGPKARHTFCLDQGRHYKNIYIT